MAVIVVSNVFTVGTIEVSNFFARGNYRNFCFVFRGATIFRILILFVALIRYPCPLLHHPIILIRIFVF